MQEALIRKLDVEYGYIERGEPVPITHEIVTPKEEPERGERIYYLGEPENAEL